MRRLFVGDGLAQVVHAVLQRAELALERLDQFLLIEDGLGELGVLALEVGVADLEIDEAAFHGREAYQRPELVQMSPKQQGLRPGGLLDTATRWEPVASDATATHCWPEAVVPAVSFVHVAPESPDVQMSFALPCALAATRCAPVASDATVTQIWTESAGAFVRFVHVAPASEDVQMSPGRPVLTATRCVPVASDATACQFLPDAAVPWVWFVHVTPESEDVQMSPYAVMATRFAPVASEARSTQVCAAANVAAV